MEWIENPAAYWTWSEEISNRQDKEAVARNVADRMREGEIIGVGSGSTVYLALLAMASRIKEKGLHIKVIPASWESAVVCSQLRIPQITLLDGRPDWTFDGADEVDPGYNLIKGRGGALFKEKLLLKSSAENYIIIDESKRVSRLGTRHPVPVEIFPQALAYVEVKLRQLGAYEVILRSAKGKDGPVITENGNMILDVRFKTIEKSYEEEIKKITGVIESGLFIDYPLQIWIK